MSLAEDAVAAAFRAEGGRIRAALVRILGSFEPADDALAEACAVALARWPIDGVPDNPAAWLTTTAKRKAIDGLRRRRRFDSLGDLDELDELDGAVDAAGADDLIGSDASTTDDRLRLLFCACHPAVARDDRIALTLQALAGLSVDEIARAFLVSPAAMAQRLVRVKRRIALARIPFELPEPDVLPERLDGVLDVLYLLFNEGYAATDGDTLMRTELTVEAIRLARLVAGLLPTPECQGLLALMLLIDARAAARVDVHGALVPLEDQDRQRWNQAQIDEGRALLLQALARRRVGPYQLQAAIAAVHDDASTAAATDWPQIAALYLELGRFWPAPMVALNHAVAVAMAGDLKTGLATIDRLQRDPQLRQSHVVQAARADLLRRLHRFKAASAAYRRAIALCRNGAERRFLERRLSEVAPTADRS